MYFGVSIDWTTAFSTSKQETMPPGIATRERGGGGRGREGGRERERGREGGREGGRRRRRREREREREGGERVFNAQPKH